MGAKYRIRRHITYHSFKERNLNPRSLM